MPLVFYVKVEMKLIGMDVEVPKVSSTKGSTTMRLSLLTKVCVVWAGQPRMPCSIWELIAWDLDLVEQAKSRIVDSSIIMERYVAIFKNLCFCVD